MRSAHLLVILTTCLIGCVGPVYHPGILVSDARLAERLAAKYEPTNVACTLRHRVHLDIKNHNLTLSTITQVDRDGGMKVVALGDFGQTLFVAQRTPAGKITATCNMHRPSRRLLTQALVDDLYTLYGPHPLATESMSRRDNGDYALTEAAASSGHRVRLFSGHSLQPTGWLDVRHGRCIAAGHIAEHTVLESPPRTLPNTATVTNHRLGYVSRLHLLSADTCGQTTEDSPSP